MDFDYKQHVFKSPDFQSIVAKPSSSSLKHPYITSLHPITFSVRASMGCTMSVTMNHIQNWRD
jgi:hypothetical protein